jgi:hypothetical protein
MFKAKGLLASVVASMVAAAKANNVMPQVDPTGISPKKSRGEGLGRVQASKRRVAMDKRDARKAKGIAKHRRNMKRRR